MKKIVIMLCWLMPLLVSAQEKTAINFSTAHNWDELVEQSAISGKPILIDAFTTWCIPCRKMDKEVFTDHTVADFINKNFVFIRIQMDSTKNDNDFVKDWHKEIAKFRQYVTAYPAFLFFNTQGEFMNKELGAYDPQPFVALLGKSIDQENNYSLQLANFKQGALAKKQHLKLALTAQENKDGIVKEIARSYKSKYIDNASPEEAFTSDALFIGKFNELFSTKDQVIKTIYFNPFFTDSLLDKAGFVAQGILDESIARDYIYPYILDNDKPIENFSNWKSIEKSISKDFDKKRAEKLVMNTKVFFAHKKNDLKEAAKLEIERIIRFGFDTTGMGRAFVNNMIYTTVFKHSEDRKVLKKAAEIMQQINEMELHKSTNHLDTYASILYKAGEKQKALEVESSALRMAEEKKDEIRIRFYTEVIERMKKDEEIWR